MANVLASGTLHKLYYPNNQICTSTGQSTTNKSPCYRVSSLVVLVDEVKICFLRFQLEKGHALECFGSRGHSPALYAWAPLRLCWSQCEIPGNTCHEVKHIRENLQDSILNFKILWCKVGGKKSKRSAYLCKIIYNFYLKMSEIKH